MEFIARINDAVNNIVWGLPMLVLLIGTGLFLTIRCGFLQFRKFGFAMRNTFGKMFDRKRAGKGAVTPFQAVSTALSATVGTGNIAGITAAITLGGAGAVFWVWVSALIGMCTKYAEVVLALRYRERNKKGDWVGGPMYYITNGLGKNWKWLAVIFSLFGALAAFGIGNAVQVGSITSAINTSIQAFIPSMVGTDAAVNLIAGIIIAALVGLVLLGGIKRIGSVAEMLVPFMAIIYIVSALIVVFANIGNIGSAFSMIFKGAFDPSAVVGGAAGVTLKTCITWGFKRGVFSNEAGLGSAPIAHAAADTDGPVQQGVWGIFEVFVDTIVICTLTALPILMTGVMDTGAFEYGVKGSTAVNVAAFATVFGDKVGSLIIAIGLTLFAFSTILGWALYGTRCIEYVFGTGSIKLYQIIYVGIVIVGATMDLSLAWNISDTLNGLMAIPNLIGLVGLSGVVVKITRDFFRKQNRLQR
ncbi:MAG TPA: sodium:alanine symporter family protein [Clostridiales bacterium]|nr:sodium:alanine symporter family protein [Clostridiales bacterium]